MILRALHTANIIKEFLMRNFATNIFATLAAVSISSTLFIGIL